MHMFSTRLAGNQAIGSYVAEGCLLVLVECMAVFKPASCVVY
jgi:hypothetical protein